MQIRPATLDEIPQLKASIAPDEEQVPFHRSVTFVVEHENELTHFASARLVWLVEPLKELPAAAKLRQNAKRRSVLGLTMAVEEWIGDRNLNRSGIYDYLCHIVGERFQSIVRHYGLIETIKDAIWFRKQL